MCMYVCMCKDVPVCVHMYVCARMCVCVCYILGVGSVGTHMNCHNEDNNYGSSISVHTTAERVPCVIHKRD